jgi:hypothetical protein
MTPRAGAPTSGVTVLDAPAALRSFVRGLVDAFRGAIVPGAAGPRPGTDQVGTHVADPSQVWPVRTSQFGAPSSQARPVVGILPEYASFRLPFSGKFFVADPAIYQRVVRRRMQAPLSVRALTPSTQAHYRAPMYVGVGPGNPEATPTTPAARIFGGR